MLTTGETRSYRCTYFPKDKQGVPQPCDSGALPSIQVRAANANAAELLAGATVNGLVAHVERIDEETVGLALEAVQ